MRRSQPRVKEYWASFSDLITNLLLIFVFIFIIFVMKIYFDNLELIKLREDDFNANSELVRLNKEVKAKDLQINILQKKIESFSYYVVENDLLKSQISRLKSLLDLEKTDNSLLNKKLNTLTKINERHQAFFISIESDLDNLRSSFTGFEIEGPDSDGNLRIVLGENLIKFSSGNANVSTLSRSAKSVLLDVGKQIKVALDKYPSLFTITIEGYTDTSGNVDYNYLLSYQRANNVMLYWKENVGLDPDKNDITASGFGEMHSKLRVKTRNNVHKKENRRIEIRITPKFKTLMQHLIELNLTTPVEVNGNCQNKANSRGLCN